MCIIVLQIFNLKLANKRKEAQRVSLGYSAKLVDRSMQNHFHELTPEEEAIAKQQEEDADKDLTDKQNPFFIYVL